MIDPSRAEWLEQVVLSRATVHDYSPEPLPEELVQRALQLALAAPNHRLTEPTRFVLVGSETRKQLSDISVALKQRKGPMSERVEQEVRAKIETPPVLVVLCRVRREKAEVEREDYATIACGVQSMMAWLWAQGIGSKWSTGAVTTAGATYQALGVPEADQEIVGFLWLGRPAKAPQRPTRKLTLEQAVRRLP
jgi:nitroreductase